MARIAVITLPIHGGLRPILGTVRELVNRGEEVYFYSTEEYRAYVEATGAKFSGYKGKLDTVEVVDDDMVRFLKSMVAMTRDKLDHHLEDIRALHPDYIVHDSMCIWGKQIAALLDIPAVSLMHSYPMTKGSMPPFSLDLLWMGIQLGVFAVTSRFDSKSDLSQMRQIYGIDPDLQDMGINRQGLNIVYTTEELEPTIAANEADYLFVGPSFFFDKEKTDFPFAQLLGEKVVYISLGTVHNDNQPFYERCFEELAGGPYQVVISTGAKVDPGDLGPAPENFIVRRWNPQQQLLAHTDLFVTHSGMNSVNESLFHGVPMLLLPHQAEQECITRRVCELGAGLRMQLKRLPSQHLRKTIDHMLSTSTFSRAAGVLSRSFQQLEPQAHIRAADAIQAYGADA